MGQWLGPIDTSRDPFGIPVDPIAMTSASALRTGAEQRWQ